MVKLDDKSECYSMKRNSNGNIELTRKSCQWNVEFTNIFRNIRREYTMIITHPQSFLHDEEVDFIMFRL
ncbi:hypothetical protein BB775_12330 [Enterobacter roggenkampii]|nr:hypothetical protein BB775_12330 [Enterobacter roggenkampii]